MGRKIAWAKKLYDFSEQDSIEALKRKRKYLSKKYHPDQGGSDEMMKNVNVAYEILSKYIKRRNRSA